MSPGTISGIVTAVLLVLFVAGWIWAWSPRRKQEFDDAAQLPLDDRREDMRDAGRASEHRETRR